MSDPLLETEVWGLLASGEQFTARLAEFTRRFGPPITEKRLSLQVSDFDHRELDTRIRIINAQPVLIQKLGDWDAEARQEVVLSLPADPVFLARLYGMLGTMLTSANTQRIAMQFENYLFDTPDTEIKLTRQFGKSEVFSFEVEKKVQAANLLTQCAELGLSPDLSEKNGEYWKEFSGRVNLSLDGLSEARLGEVIRPYLVPGT